MKNNQNDKTITIKEHYWKKFPTPKNSAMALGVEVAELMEHFSWLGSKVSVKTPEKNREAIEYKVADARTYLSSLCTHYKIDLARALEKKGTSNNEKYPVEKCKGIATTYRDL